MEPGFGMWAHGPGLWADSEGSGWDLLCWSAGEVGPVAGEPGWSSAGEFGLESSLEVRVAGVEGLVIIARGPPLREQAAA